jgi:hypothetical protein
MLRGRYNIDIERGLTIVKYRPKQGREIRKSNKAGEDGKKYYVNEWKCLLNQYIVISAY